jgi:hypothetical protein
VPAVRPASHIWAWGMMKCVVGVDGIIIGPCISWPISSWFGSSRGEKNGPSLTVAQVHLLLLAVLPKRACDTDWVLEVLQYRQERNDAAYLAHRKQRELRFH